MRRVQGEGECEGVGEARWCGGVGSCGRRRRELVHAIKLFFFLCCNFRWHMCRPSCSCFIMICFSGGRRPLLFPGPLVLLVGGC